MHGDLSNASLGRIHRAPDGRFVLVDSALASRANSVSNSSSSDDGGFLPRRGTGNRASWRRPLVGYPSQLSLRSEGSGQSARGGFHAFLGVLGTLAQPRYHHPISLVPIAYSPTTHLPMTPRFQSSSPATSSALLPSPWSPMYFSDLSSVKHPSSAERSFPTPPGYMQLRSVHQRYSQELPSLRAIHEETRSNQGFIPVHPLTSPGQSLRVPPPYPTLPATGFLGPNLASVRPRARLFPRHARMTRSAPELASPDHIALHETSPESRSSSSGFGSKNTSQQNQSSRSGSSSAEWRLPPYRPPPPPPAAIHKHQHPLQHHQQLQQPLPPPPPPPLVGQWLAFTSQLGDSSPLGSEPTHKAVDVGSVDGHYEFDPATPTPTPSTPTVQQQRDERGATSDTETLPSRKSFVRNSRYDNIEARVQAMKEEFHEFRKRQAKRRRSQELESAC